MTTRDIYRKNSTTSRVIGKIRGLKLDSVMCVTFLFTNKIWSCVSKIHKHSENIITDAHWISPLFWHKSKSTHLLVLLWQKFVILHLSFVCQLIDRQQLLHNVFGNNEPNWFQCVLPLSSDQQDFFLLLIASKVLRSPHVLLFPSRTRNSWFHSFFLVVCER